MEKPRLPSVHVKEVVVDEFGRKVEQVVSSPICDFCADIGPAWDYPCDDFMLGPPSTMLPFASSEGWAACSPCHALIEHWEATGDLVPLVDRACSPWGEHPKELREAYRHDLFVIYRAFAEHRTGAPIPWG